MKILEKFKLSDNTKKINKTDWIVMGILVLIYGIISFIRLGDTKAPSTFKTFTSENDTVVLTLEEKTIVNKMRYYVGDGLGDVGVSYSVDGIEYFDLNTINIGGVFYWADININEMAKYIRLSNATPNVSLGEVAFYDASFNQLKVVENNLLTDENDLVPDEISFMNSTYFDEIYYARTAYEYVHGIDVYEWTHPPLGKLLMTIPIYLFGFSPFTYRLIINIFGIMLIPLMYILTKKIFKNRKWALLGALIMMFDNFHFVHTRIALVDGFQVFFILLSVLFMKEYLDLDKKDSFGKKAKYLLLSGTFIGCAIDTKWNAAYVALGLAVVFFVHLFKDYKTDIIKFCKSRMNFNYIYKCITLLVIIPVTIYYLIFLVFTKDAAKLLVIIYFAILAFILLIICYRVLLNDKSLFKLFGICILSFIVIPLVIYILSYLLFPHVSYYDGTLKGIIDINKMMYDYHSGLDATHPFSSVWYEWPVMAKPVWFYSGNTVSGLRMTITDIGNPAIWWFGIASFIYLVISAIKKKDKTHIFLLIFILSTFIPYVFIGRLMFMYHYFITLPFIMLGIVAFIKYITEKTKSNKFYFGYIAFIIVMFTIFYPIVSALPMNSDYIDSLKWLSGWYF